MSETKKGEFKDTVKDTIESAEKTAESSITKTLARFGFFTKGVLFIIIGILAVLAAIGFEQSGELAGAKGALTTIAQAPFGKVLLIIFIIGSGAYGCWNILRGIADIDDNGTDKMGLAKRLFAAALGIFYILLGVVAVYVLFTSNAANESGETGIPKTLTAILLDFPFGVILVILIGLGFLGAAFVIIYQALSLNFLDKFKSLEDKDGHQRKLVVTTGIAGFIARALLFGLIGYFLVSAAVNYDPQKVVGIDGALRALAEQTYGQIILFFTAFGLICYGFLSILKSRFRSLE